MSGGVVIIDKPGGWTSHDVVARLRGLFGERRIGHGGTLDPMATGVLPVFVGKATKAVEFCESADKEYIASVRLGIVTDTQDTTGSVISRSDGCVGREEFESALRRFVGEQMQLPPMYSAVKVGGRKLYEIARKGKSVERVPRRITIKELELLSGAENEYRFRVVCSKGTYIRTLCHDVGIQLGCGGAMASLRRTRAGRFLLRDAVMLETVAAKCADGGGRELLLPVETLFDDLPRITVGADDERRCRCGAPVTLPEHDGRYRICSVDGEFLLIGDLSDHRLSVVKSFY